MKNIVFTLALLLSAISISASTNETQYLLKNVNSTYSEQEILPLQHWFKIPAKEYVTLKVSSITLTAKAMDYETIRLNLYIQNRLFDFFDVKPQLSRQTFFIPQNITLSEIEFVPEGIIRINKAEMEIIE